MKTAINLYFAKMDTKLKLDSIKSAGFDGVLLGICDKSETMTLKEQVDYCRKIDLGISMIHCHYYEPLLNTFWLEGSSGDNILKDLVNQIERISTYDVKNFVIHTNGGKDVKTTDFGINRLRELLKTCEKYNINLNIENLYSVEQIEYIFKSIKHKNLTFCYDYGHENFLTPNQRFAKIYKNKITTTHLHDNNSLADEHLNLGQGNIDLDILAQDLSLSHVEYLTLELRFRDKNINLNQYLRDAFLDLQNLKSKVEYYKSIR